MKNLKALLVVSLFLVVACDKAVFIGNSKGGFKKDLNFPITPIEAHAKAKPWLEKTYQLKLKSRINILNRPLVDTIILKGHWYYVSRDNYPYKAIQAYLYHAVRVHVSTGKVIAPE